MAARENQDVTRKVAIAGILVMILVVVGILCSLPKAAPMLRVLWPEQVVLLGLVAWVAAGPNWLAVGLAGVGVVARLILFAQWSRTSPSPSAIALRAGEGAAPEDGARA
jgi:hypothetical protein